MSGTAQQGVECRPTVFLSYARADQATARKLAHALQEAGLQVWWDTLIEGGAVFAKSIEAALERCDAVVVVWSSSSAASDWVLDEAARGRELHKLVPVTLDGTLRVLAPPAAVRLRRSLDSTSDSPGLGPPDRRFTWLFTLQRFRLNSFSSCARS